MSLPLDDLLVLAIGHPLRSDDTVGFVVLDRLRAHFGEALMALDLYEMDVSVAETMASRSHLLVIDALAPGAPRPGGVHPGGRSPDEAPFLEYRLEANPTVATPGGFLSHVFDWGLLLALSRDLYGRAPETTLLAIRGHQFGLGEELSVACRANADEAFEHLRTRLR